jgi:hypothetical protein
LSLPLNEPLTSGYRACFLFLRAGLEDALARSSISGDRILTLPEEYGKGYGPRRLPRIWNTPCSKFPSVNRVDSATATRRNQ